MCRVFPLTWYKDGYPTSVDFPLKFINQNNYSWAITISQNDNILYELYSDKVWLAGLPDGNMNQYPIIILKWSHISVFIYFSKLMHKPAHKNQATLPVQLVLERQLIPLQYSQGYAACCSLSLRCQSASLRWNMLHP